MIADIQYKEVATLVTFLIDHSGDGAHGAEVAMDVIGV
ncbi:hypothetical protein EDO6_00518 [Paenibacillus xylanexedens]|nr:hypothetical protein EDO6_00518 [Paenibacillus xylanexedens]